MTPVPGKPVGLMVPHAGHRYSGAVAAHAFRLVRGLPVDVVALVGPLHHPARVPAPVFTIGHEAYLTPLGPVPVDAEALERLDVELRADLGQGPVPLVNDPEHSLEIELPFLQRTLGHFRLLPLMLRDQSVHVARAVGRALGRALAGRSALIVGSSDLSHFYPQPIAERLDSALLARVEAFDPDGVLSAEDEGIGFACGKGAIAASLWAAEALGATRARVVNHATSGTVTGEFDSVVGYGAAIVYDESSSF